MSMKRGNFQIFQLLIYVLLLILSLFLFGGVSQTNAPFSYTKLAPVVFYPIYFIAAGLVILLFCWFSSLVRSGRITFGATSIDIPILLLLLYVAVRALLSMSPYLVKTEFLRLLILAGFFYGAVNIIDTKEKTKTVIYILLGATLLISIYGLINTMVLKNETVLWLKRFKGYENRVSATYICPNHFAGLLEMVLPFTLSYIVMSKMKTMGKTVIGIAGLVMLVAMVFTLSRGGWVSSVAGMVTVVLVSIRKAKVPLAAVLAPAIVATILLVFIAGNEPTLYDRVTATWSEEEESVSSRKDVWQDTLKMVYGTKLMGSDPGTYEYAITRFQRAGFFTQINYAHNDYLQMLAEYGIIGLGIVVAIILIVARTCGRMLNLVKEHDDFAYVAGYLGAFVAVGVHSFVDFNMRIPGNAMLMLSLTGMLFALRRYSIEHGREFVLLDIRALSKSRASFSVIPIFLALLLVVIGLVITARRYLGEYYHHLAKQEDVSAPEPINKEIEIPEDVKKTVVDNYLMADRFDSQNPAHAGALANVFVLQNRRSKDYDQRALLLKLLKDKDIAEKTLERVENSIRYGEKAINGNPYKGLYHLRLAQAYEFLSNIIGGSEYGIIEIDSSKYKSRVEYLRLARKELEAAVAQAPNLPYYHTALAESYLRQREYENARKSALKAIELLEKRPVWQSQKAVEVLEKIADHYYRIKEYALAEKALIEAMREMNGDLEWKRKKAKMLLDEIERNLAQQPEKAPAGDTN
jgi:O-antigen ligase